MVGRIRFALERFASPRQRSHVAQLFSLGIIRTMKFRRFTICLFVAGLFATGYLYWARDRADSAVRPDIRQPWPYPDHWLSQWYQRLAADHPVTPGFVQIEGELPRLQFYLDGLIGLSAVVTFICFFWLWNSRKIRP